MINTRLSQFRGLLAVILAVALVCSLGQPAVVARAESYEIPLYSDEITNELYGDLADEPTNEPEDEPTGEPNGEPADEPSDEPSDDPADEPEDESTYEPEADELDEPELCEVTGEEECVCEEAQEEVTTLADSLDLVAPTIAVLSAYGSPGEVIYLTVSIQDNPGVSGFSLTMQYPEDSLEFIEAIPGDEVSRYFSAFTDTKNQVSIRAVAPSPPENAVFEGELFTISFRILWGTLEGRISGVTLGYHRGIDTIAHGFEHLPHTTNQQVEVTVIPAFIATYSVTYQFTGTVPAGAAALLPAAQHDIAPGTPMTRAPSPTLPRYTFSGWSTTSNVMLVGNNFNMPNNDVVFTGYWASDDQTGGDYTAPAITSSMPSSAAVGVHFSHTFTATGVPTPTWSHTGTLPSGLELSTSGVLSGTPTLTGSFSFTVIATNDVGSATQTVAMVIGQAPEITAYGPFTPQRLFANVSFTLQAVGNPAPTWSVDGGSLPPGLSFNPATGVISGITMAPGVHTLYVRSSNIVGYDTAAVVVGIPAPPAPPVINNSNPPNGVVGVVYSGYTFTANVPATWTSTGTLPPGLNLNSDGALSGTPTARGSFTFTVMATAANGVSATQTVTIVIQQAPEITVYGSFTPQRLFANVSFTLQAVGNPTPTWSVDGGSLPPGLSFNPATGVISGITMAFGVHTLYVRSSNIVGYDTAAVVVGIPAPIVPPVVNNPNPPRGVEDVLYNYQLTSNNPDVIWSVPSPGALPPGLNLNPNGSITGTPDSGSEGSYTFTVTATCPDNGASSSREVTIVIRPPLRINDPGTIPPIRLFTNSNFQLTTSGGVPPITIWGWAAAPSSSLPPGLSINSNGAIVGIAMQNGTFDVIVTAIDSSGAMATRTLTIVTGTGVALPPVTNVTMTPARILANYEFRVSTVSDAPGPWVLSGGTSLPPGLTLSTVGGGTAITGRPTQRNTFNFQLTAADGVTTINFTLVVS